MAVVAKIRTKKPYLYLTSINLHNVSLQIFFLMVILLYFQRGLFIIDFGCTAGILNCDGYIDHLV